jgi:hypothetical protein
MLAATTLPTAAAERRGRRFLVLLLVASLLAVTSAGAADASTQSVTSNAWAGVVDHGLGLTRIGGDFTIPRVSAQCGGSSNVAIWVGLGGYGSLTFAQNGINVTPTGIGVWYELVDGHGNGPVVSVPLRMRQGDVVRLGLRFSANHSVLTFSWMNLTRHTSAARTVRNATRYYNGSSAEWIVERPGIDRLANTANLARFSPIVFSHAWTGTLRATRSALPAPYSVHMFGRSARPLTSGPVTTAATGTVSVRWLACS